MGGQPEASGLEQATRVEWVDDPRESSLLIIRPAYSLFAAASLAGRGHWYVAVRYDLKPDCKNYPTREAAKQAAEAALKEALADALRMLGGD